METYQEFLDRISRPKLLDLSTISTTFIFWKVRCSLFPNAVVYFNSTASKEDIYCGEIDAEFFSKK